MQKRMMIEWPSVALFVLVYGLWWLAVFVLPVKVLWASILLAALAIAFHASLQHEAIHGHPFQWQWANVLLAWPPLALVIPYLRYRDTHLQHHQDSQLTDPYDDPESNYFDPGDWDRMAGWAKRCHEFNNTLAGRLIIGPLLGTVAFLRSETRTLGTDPKVLRGWLWHIPAVLPVVLLVLWSPMPLWAYVAAVYLALSLLRIRTFLEHQAHELARARSVIVEDRGPLALLFLNNNLHAVHHAHPGVAWYRLPGLYARDKERFLRLNEGYRFRSYGEVFRQYMFRRKDPLAHPLRSRD